MNSWVSKGLLAAAIILPTLSGTAWAGGGDDLGCSNATLKWQVRLRRYRLHSARSSKWSAGGSYRHQGVLRRRHSHPT